MKNGWVILSLMVVFSPLVVLAEYREFTAQDGKTIRAKVLGYSKATDMVEIERDTGKRFKVKADIFCEQDQSIVRNWDQVKGFISTQTFVISVKRVAKEANVQLRPGEYGGKAGYQVLLENRRGMPLKNLRMETSLYQTLRFVRKDPSGKVDSFVSAGSPVQNFDIGEVGGREKKVFPTELLQENRVDTGSRDKETGELYHRWQELNVAGIWIRLTMQLPDGTEVVREFKEPADCWDGFVWHKNGPFDPNQKQKPREDGEK